MISISTAERRRRLQTRHRLTASTRVHDVVPVADSMVALHATDPATVFLSAWARMSSGSQSEIAEAIFADRRLVRLIAMRRTLFAVSTELAPVVQASSAVGVATTQRRKLLSQLTQAGVVGDVETWLAEVEQSTYDALVQRGSATAVELVQDEPRLNTILDLAPDKAYAAPQKITSRVLTVLALQGKLVRGATLGGWTTNRVQWWPATSWLPGGLGDADIEQSRIDLARRWLQAFGPAPLKDLQWWTGWTLGRVRATVKSIATDEVQLDDGPGLVLAGDLDSTPEPEPAVALLPALDPTPMGWVQREWFLGEHREQLFDRTGNIGPTIFWQGRVVGGWAQHQDGEIRCRLLEDIGPTGTDAVQDRAAELTEWLGPLRFVPRFRTPLERELTQ